jgi:BirA family transcriptional regulator, biotin operon repressor / biotin---[acetyl-CoA-carboxylase] ligase
MNDAPVAAWPMEAISQLVLPHLPGFLAQVVPTIDSTNSELMRRARAGQRGPVLLVAQRQTAGRGRLGRSWHSDAADTEPASLTFSLALPLKARDLAGLSLAVGVGVARCLHPQLRLKWPNDIWLHERKLAGILIETAVFDSSVHAVIGIGINIGLPRDAAHFAQPPAALHELLPGVGAPDVLQRVVPVLVQDVLLFEAQGLTPFLAAFQARDLLSGRAVVLSDGSTGTAAGVDGVGALLVHTAAGMKTITSAEVSVRPAPRGARGA